jgi:predicted MFS family arabinose efflux permease
MNEPAVSEIRSRTVLPLGILAAAGFVSSAGARVIDPLLAVIAQDFHVSVPAMSIVIAAFTLPYGLNQLLLGPVGDRIGKLRLMFGALCFYAVFTGACALAANLQMLTLARACAGAASAGLIPACLAYIGDAIPYERRNLAISRFLIGVVLAQMMAGPVGGVFGQFLGWRGVFVLLSGIAVVVAAVLFVGMQGVSERSGDFTFNPGNYTHLARSPAARYLLVATLVEGAMMGGVFPFIAPFLHQEYGLSIGAAGFVLACFGLGALIQISNAARIVPRLGEAGLVAVGGVLISLAFAAAAVVAWWQAFVVIQAVLGVGYFMLHPVLQTRASELLPAARSTAVSFFVFMLFLGFSLGALAFAGLIATVGYRTAFLIDAAGVALLSAWLWRFVRHSPP